MKIIILIEGGSVQDIKADEPGEVEIAVLDWDNAKAGDDENRKKAEALQQEFDAMNY